MYKKIKRVLDSTLAFLMIIMLLPMLLLISLCIRLQFKESVFFIQERPGKNGCLFKMIKFKTMNNDKDKKGRLLPDAQRITALGRFLRATSLDELPELFNVLRGDMSLVGPRPLLTEYLPLYSTEQSRRHSVLPGITGWAQVNGRNALTWDQKLNLDIWYVDNQSFYIDIKILFLTFYKTIKREGINHHDNLPMPKFTGNK